MHVLFRINLTVAIRRAAGIKGGARDADSYS
jgi:hypothetical protein